MNFKMIPYSDLRDAAFVIVVVWIKVHAGLEKGENESSEHFAMKNIGLLKQSYPQRYNELCLLLKTVEILGHPVDSDEQTVVLNALIYFLREVILRSYASYKALMADPRSSTVYKSCSTALEITKSNVPGKLLLLHMYGALALFLDKNMSWSTELVLHNNPKPEKNAFTGVDPAFVREYIGKVLQFTSEVEIALLPDNVSRQVREVRFLHAMIPDAALQSLTDYQKLKIQTYAAIIDLLHHHGFVDKKSDEMDVEEYLKKIEANVGKLSAKYMDRYNQSRFLLATIALLDRDNPQADVLYAANCMVKSIIKESYGNDKTYPGIVYSIFVSIFTNQDESMLYSKLNAITNKDFSANELILLYGKLVCFIEKHTFEASELSISQQKIYLSKQAYSQPHAVNYLKWLYGEICALKTTLIGQLAKVSDNEESDVVIVSDIATNDEGSSSSLATDWSMVDKSQPFPPC